MLKKEEVIKVAQLARLALTSDEVDSIQKQLSAVLENFEQLSSVNTEGIEPLVTASDIKVHWRTDIAEKKLTAEELLTNAPDKVGQLFKVPPVVS